MQTIEEMRDELLPLVGQKVTVNRAGPWVLFAVEQAAEDEQYGAWAAGDWIMAVGDPSTNTEPGEPREGEEPPDPRAGWSWSTLAYNAEHGVVVAGVQT
jgi:hypothetical protein